MSDPGCGFYEVRIRGTLTSSRWGDWFDGFMLTTLENGDTLLCGFVRDQSELLGVLEKIANLSLVLISINPIDGKELRRSSPQ